VPFAVAAERVGRDPARIVSRDLAFLRSTYDVFEALAPTAIPYDWRIDTSTTTVDEVVDVLAPALR